MKFTTEKSIQINNSDFSTVRNLYAPIIGPSSVCLYELLIDYSNLPSQILSYYPLSDLSSTLGISSDELNISRKKLEAVGLLRSFEKADNFHFIFVINKPLTVSQIKSNTILYNEITKKISMEVFERFEYNHKTRNNEKSEFKETTLKFQELFALDKQEAPQNNTIELPKIKIESIEEAMNALNPAQFASFLTNKQPQRSLVTMLSDLSSLSFSSRTLNTIIKYSYDVNGKIVTNHVSTIARDLLQKDKTTFFMVNEELKSALENRVNSVLEAKESNSKHKNSQLDLNDVFNQIGEL